MLVRYNPFQSRPCLVRANVVSLRWQSISLLTEKILYFLTWNAPQTCESSLTPYSANLKKRLVKAPKVYLRDPGILHALLEIDTLEDLLGHPVAGASWEGFCLEQIISAKPGWRPSFYRTSSGEEIDQILERGRKKLAFEFKASMSPKVSRGFSNTLEILQPDHTWIVAPVPQSYPFQRDVTVSDIFTVLAEI